MKLLIGTLMILGSSSMVMDKDSTFASSDMKVPHNSKVISGHDMVVINSTVTDKKTKKANECNDLTCWDAIIKSSLSQ